MTLPASGGISLAQVNAELARPATQVVSMDEWPLRWLAGAGGSGTGYSMSQFHGKSAIIREPASGEYAQRIFTSWNNFGSQLRLYWGGVHIFTGNSSTTSATVGAWTYFRGGTYQYTYEQQDPTGNWYTVTEIYYGVWRQRQGP
jgi:hypothetical protein